MKTQKPSIPKGTRDFGPEQMVNRSFIFDNIKQVFQKFGFMNLETPSMEYLSVLTGKYGDEGDQLIFKILRSGDYLSKASIAATATEIEAQGNAEAPLTWQQLGVTAKALTPKIAEKALRYDLTVPFARFVSMHRGNLPMPFKRYQIQPVWRADRPQRGRYQEFYQCDADVVGTDALLCEAEIIAMVNEVFAKLGIANYSLKMNNRKVLTGITEAVGAAGKEGPFCVAIDKLDKIGMEKVNEELRHAGFEDDNLEKLAPILAMQGSNLEKLSTLKNLLQTSETGLKGLQELEEALTLTQQYQPNAIMPEFDITLARGLTYYTGAIFEVKPLGVKMGSIAGGGRYDNLTGVFGYEGVSGVGISFGVDRIYDVMEELDLYPIDNQMTTRALIVNFGADTMPYALKTLNSLRQAGVASELYPTAAKMNKQFTYAEKKRIPFVVFTGSDEEKNNTLTLKDVAQGSQQTVTLTQALEIITP